MAFTPVNDGDLAVAPQVQQILDAMSGVVGAGQPIAFTSLDSSTDPALALKNLDSAGWALHVYSHGGADLFDVRDAYTDVDSGTLRVDHANNRVGVNNTSPTVALDVTGAIKASGGFSSGGTLGFTAGTDPANPGLYVVGDTNTGLYAPAADQLAITAGGSQIANFTTTAVNLSQRLSLNGGSVLQGTQASPSVSASNTGYLFWSTGNFWSWIGSTGSAHVFADLDSTQSLSNKTLTSPIISTLTTAGDVMVGTGTGAIKRLGLGSAYQNLATNSAANDVAYQASLQSLMTAQGDIVQASSANTPVRLALGTAFQAPLVNSGATALSYQDTPTKILTAQGDLLGASAANTLARVAKGTAFQEFVMNSGATSQQYANGPLALASAAGDTFYATGANALAKLTLPTKGLAYFAGASAPVGDIVYRRNYLVNSACRVTQRTSASLANGTTDNSYGPDRWRLLLEAANAATILQETADLPTNGSQTGFKLTVGSGNNNKFGIWQVLEGRDCQHLRGKTVSLQLKMKATAGIGDVRVGIVEWGSTADAVSGDPISSWGAAGTNPTLAANYAYSASYTPVSLSPTTSWATYTVEGKALGSSFANLAVFIWCDDKTTTQTTDILRITDIQIEEGSLCTAYVPMPPTMEYNECLRWLYIPGSGEGSNYTYIGNAKSGSTIYAEVFYWPILMRGVPAVSSATYAASTGSNGTTTLNNVGPYSSRPVNLGSGWTIDAQISLQAVISAEL